MSSAKPKDKRIQIQDLAFYFDSQTKDRLDCGELGRKSGLVLALREKLLAMPPSEFDAAIKTIEKLVSVPGSNEEKEGMNRRRGARELYERTASPTSEEIRKI